MYITHTLNMFIIHVHTKPFSWLLLVELITISIDDWIGYLILRVRWYERVSVLTGEVDPIELNNGRHESLSLISTNLILRDTIESCLLHSSPKWLQFTCSSRSLFVRAWTKGKWMSGGRGDRGRRWGRGVGVWIRWLNLLQHIYVPWVSPTCGSGSSFIFVSCWPSLLSLIDGNNWNTTYMYIHAPIKVYSVILGSAYQCLSLKPSFFQTGQH